MRTPPKSCRGVTRRTLAPKRAVDDPDRAKGPRPRARRLSARPRLPANARAGSACRRPRPPPPTRRQRPAARRPKRRERARRRPRPRRGRPRARTDRPGAPPRACLESPAAFRAVSRRTAARRGPMRAALARCGCRSRVEGSAARRPAIAPGSRRARPLDGLGGARRARRALEAERLRSEGSRRGSHRGSVHVRSRGCRPASFIALRRFGVAPILSCSRGAS